MTPPYREPAELPTSAARPPNEFVYFANRAERQSAALRSLAGYLWLTALASGALIAAWPAVGSVVSLAAIAFLLWRWRHTRRPERIVVRILDGVVEITGTAEPHTFPLGALRDVHLQTRSIEKVYADKLVGTAVVSMGVMPSVDVSRLVLVHEDDEHEHEIVLGEGYDPSTHVMEWLGKLRLHLRKHGWVPADEA